MRYLSRADLEAALAFVGEIAELALVNEVYSPLLLSRLQELISCDALTYQEFQYETRRDHLLVSVEGGATDRWDASADEPTSADGQLYWNVGPCPIVHYRIREHDLEAVRMSDVIPRRYFRELPVYREYFRPLGLAHALDLGLPVRSLHQRSLILFRADHSSDFSERDRELLELLRPHLYSLEARAAQQRPQVHSGRQRPHEHHGDPRVVLTAREREVVELVAEGKTNAEIAAELWVAPSTVKKHLEHVYAKVGVGRRAAAISLLHPAQHGATRSNS